MPATTARGMAASQIPAVGELAERRLRGSPAAGGIAVGPVYRLAEIEVATAPRAPDPAPGAVGTGRAAPRTGARRAGGPLEQARAARALATLARQLSDASMRLDAAGRVEEAQILDATCLMAADPTLLADVERLAADRSAAAALVEATERHAALLAALPDPDLAARAADVRRLGRLAARLLSEPTIAQASHPRPLQPIVLVARELGPVDLADLEWRGIAVAGIALAEGGATTHAAIVARSLGIPLVVGLGDAVLDVPPGATLVLDGTEGILVAHPAPETLRLAHAAVRRQAGQRTALARDRAAGAVTRDGHAVRLLANASAEREVLAGLEAGAEGVGLLRSELAFLDVPAWPDEAQHIAALAPLARHLRGRVLTVRTLDFGADKAPPFLRGRSERGIALQLAEPDALAAQLRALLRSGADARLRILLPYVERAEQVEATRVLLAAAHAEVGGAGPLPPLGAMIETAAAVAQADALAEAADFLSVGTNDLVQDVLGLDRLSPSASIEAAAEPRVLGAIAAVVEAAARHGRAVEVCGEAAGEPRLAVLLVGLGVAELSAAPARLDVVRAAVRATTLARAAELARTALTRASAAEVLALLDRC